MIWQRNASRWISRAAGSVWKIICCRLRLPSLRPPSGLRAAADLVSVLVLPRWVRAIVQKVRSIFIFVLAAQNFAQPTPKGEFGYVEVSSNYDAINSTKTFQWVRWAADPNRRACIFFPVRASSEGFLIIIYLHRRTQDDDSCAHFAATAPFWFGLHNLRPPFQTNMVHPVIRIAAQYLSSSNLFLTVAEKGGRERDG